MPFLGNVHFCKNWCGEVFNTYYCKQCEKYITDFCKDCHQEHFNEIDRAKRLAGLKRDFKR